MSNNLKIQLRLLISKDHTCSINHFIVFGKVKLYFITIYLFIFFVISFQQIVNITQFLQSVFLCNLNY